MNQKKNNAYSFASNFVAYHEKIAILYGLRNVTFFLIEKNYFVCVCVRLPLKMIMDNCVIIYVVFRCVLIIGSIEATCLTYQ